MNKKVLVSAFALSMVFGLTGCSSEKPEEKRKIQRLLKRKKRRRKKRKKKVRMLY